jgi:SOCS box
VCVVQGERAIFDAIVNQKLDSLRLFMRYNYDFDAPCKLDYDGSGGRLPIRVALERDLHDVLRIFAATGYVFVMSIPAVPGSLVLSGGGSSALGLIGGAEGGAFGGGTLMHLNVAGGTSLKLVGVAKELTSAVRSLRSQCRRDIRRIIGFGIEGKVGSLPLPPSLRDYILLKDIFAD